MRTDPLRGLVALACAWLASGCHDSTPQTPMDSGIRTHEFISPPPPWVWTPPGPGCYDVPEGTDGTPMSCATALLACAARQEGPQVTWNLALAACWGMCSGSMEPPGVPDLGIDSDPLVENEQERELCHTGSHCLAGQRYWPEIVGPLPCTVCTQLSQTPLPTSTRAEDCIVADAPTDQGT